MQRARPLLCASFFKAKLHPIEFSIPNATMAHSEANLAERFEASMVLAGVGDALGYRNGEWEFCRSVERIHEQARELGGVGKIKVNLTNWMVSDDTVMHLATAEGLLAKWDNFEDLFSALAQKYKDCMRDMEGRGPGRTCSSSVHELRPELSRGYVIPFNYKGGGCGAAMRAAPIGLYFWKPNHIKNLVAVAIESGRMTHNHPTGYLGSLAVALFVSYAVQKKPLKEWGAGLMSTLETARKYVQEESPEKDKKHHRDNWSYFEEEWLKYLKLRGIEGGDTEPVFNDLDTGSIRARDEFYRSLSYSGTGGASGHDAPMIAYEALLNIWRPTDPAMGEEDEKERKWIDLCECSMLHGGDSDSTGIIAAACWGAMEGFNGVPENHYKELEYRDRLQHCAAKLFEKAN